MRIFANDRENRRKTLNRRAAAVGENSRREVDGSDSRPSRKRRALCSSAAKLLVSPFRWDTDNFVCVKKALGIFISGETLE